MQFPIYHSPDMREKRVTAILLAAGKGARMGGPVPKQYMDLGGRPLVCYALEALGRSAVIDDLVMVIPDGDEGYVREQVFPQVDPAATGKVRAFVPGGAERYLSVRNGIEAITWECDEIYIHDGARAFIDEATLERLYEALQDPGNHGTAVAGMPSKDTVKITDAEGFVADTPDRRNVWIVQTPQAFHADLVREAYSHIEELIAQGISITDDAMLVEHLSGQCVRMVEASYRNIKVTTPEDILIGEAFLK